MQSAAFLRVELVTMEGVWFESKAKHYRFGTDNIHSLLESQLAMRTIGFHNLLSRGRYREKAASLCTGSKPVDNNAISIRQAPQDEQKDLRNVAFKRSQIPEQRRRSRMQQIRCMSARNFLQG